MNDTGTSDPNWFRYCRIMLEWTHPKRNLDPERWVPEVVERAQKLGVNALAFDFWHGGYAIFNGSVAPKDDHVGASDLLALLDREVHKRGMYLVAMNMGAHANNYAAAEYPEWRARDAAGNPVPFAHGQLMCLNSPYGNFVLQELSEMLPRYRIDGLYVEGLYAQHCFCEYCCRDFERTYGYPIPRETSPFKVSRDYARFRADTILHFVRGMRRVIDQVSPHTVLMPSPSSWEGTFADFAGWAPSAEAMHVERQWGYQRNPMVRLWEIGMSMQSVRAESKRPPMGTTWLAWQVDADYSPCTPQHYRLNFFELLMNGATPQLHAQTIFEVDDSETETVHEMFRLEERCRPYLLDAGFIPYAALVVDWTTFLPTDYAKGFYQALMEKHVPFNVISKRDLNARELSRYKVLLLPNIERMTNEQIDAVRAFQAQGGAVVLTYRTGFLDEPNGFLRPGEYAFAQMAGIHGPYRIVTNLANNYYKVTQAHAIGAGTRGRLQSYMGSYVDVETSPGVAIAHVLDCDYSKMHVHHPVKGHYPGRPLAPLIVVNENQGQGGRVVYFTGEFDAKCYNPGLPGTIDTLAEATVWAANATPPVQVEAAPTVRVTTQFSPARKAYTIMLLNQTTNDMEPAKVIRYIQPLRDVKITLAGLESPVKSVRSMTGAPLQHDAAGNSCKITLGELKDYEVVLVELADEASSSK